MLAVTNTHPSRSKPIRSTIIFGLTLCATARTQMRIGSFSRAHQVVRKAQKVAVQAARDLNMAAELDICELHHLHSLLNRLESSLLSLDPLASANGSRRLPEIHPVVRPIR